MASMDGSDGKIDPKFFSTCRLCVSKPGSYQILPHIQKQIKELFDISVHVYDGLPQLLCEECRKVVAKVYAIRSTYQTKQKELISRNRPLHSPEDIEGNAKCSEEDLESKAPFKNTDSTRSPKEEPEPSQTDIIYTIEDDDDVLNTDYVKYPTNEFGSSTEKSSSKESKYTDSDTSSDLICIVDDDDSIQNTDGLESPTKDTKFTHISTVRIIDAEKSTSNESKYTGADISTDCIRIVKDDGPLQNMVGVQSPKNDTKFTDISTAQIICAVKSTSNESKYSDADISNDIICMVDDDDSIRNTDGVQSPRKDTKLTHISTVQNIDGVKSTSDESKYTDTDLICVVENDGTLQKMDGAQSPKTDTKFTDISTVQIEYAVKSTSNESTYTDADISTDHLCIVKVDGSLQNMDSMQSPKNATKSIDISTSQNSCVVKSTSNESKSTATETSIDLICIVANNDFVQNTKSLDSKPTDCVNEDDNSNQNAVNLNSLTNETKSSDVKCTFDDDKGKILISLSRDSNISVPLPKKHKKKWQKMYICKFCMQTFLRRYQVGPHLETHHKLIELQKAHKIKHAYVSMVRVGESRRRNSNCSETSVYLMHGFRVNNIFDNYFSSSHIQNKASKDAKDDKKEKQYTRIKRISSSSSEFEIVTDEPAAKRVNIERKLSAENSPETSSSNHYLEMNTTEKYAIERMNRSPSSSNHNNIETFKNESADKTQSNDKNPSVENAQDVLTPQYYSEIDATGKHSIKRKNRLSSSSNSSDIEKFNSDSTDKPQSEAKSDSDVINTSKVTSNGKSSSSSYTDDKPASNVKNKSQKPQSNNKLTSKIVKTVKHSIKRKSSSSSDIEIVTDNHAAKRIHTEKTNKTDIIKPTSLNKTHLQVKSIPEKNTASRTPSRENLHDASQSKLKFNPEMVKKVEHSVPTEQLDEHCLVSPCKTSKHSATKIRSRENSQDTTHPKAKHNAEVSKKLQHAGLKFVSTENQHSSPKKHTESKIKSAEIDQNLESRRKSEPEIDKNADTQVPKLRLDDNWLNIPELEAKSITKMKEKVQFRTASKTKSDSQVDKNDKKSKSSAINDSEKLSVSKVTSAENSQDTSQSKLKSNLKNQKEADHSTLTKKFSEKSLRPLKDKLNPEYNKETEVLNVQHPKNNSNQETIEQVKQSTSIKRSSEKYIDAAQSKDKINKNANDSTLKKRTFEKLLDVAQSEDKSNPDINKKAAPSPSKIIPYKKSLDTPQSKDKSNPESQKDAQESTFKRRNSEKSRDAPQSKATSDPEIYKNADQSALKRRPSEKSQDVQPPKDTSDPDIDIKEEQSPLKRRPSAKSQDVQSIDKSNFEITEKAEKTILKRRTSEEPLNSQQSKHRSETEINKAAEQSTLEIRTREESLNSLQSKHAYNQEINKKAEKSILKRRPSEKAQDLNLAHLGPQSKDTSNLEINKKAAPSPSKRRPSEKSLDTSQSKDKSNPESKMEAQQTTSKSRHSKKSRDAPQSKATSDPDIDKNANQSTLKRKPSEKSQDDHQSKYTSDPDIDIKAEQSPLKRRPSAKSLDVQSIDKSNFEITEKAEKTKLKRRTSEKPLNSQQSKHRSETELNKTAEQSTLEMRTLEESLNSLQLKDVYNQEINKKAEKSILKRRPSEKTQDLNVAHLGPQSKDTSNLEINKKAAPSPSKRRPSEKSLDTSQSKDKSNPESKKETKKSTFKRRHSKKSRDAPQSKATSDPEIDKNANQSALKRIPVEKLQDDQQSKDTSDPDIDIKAKQSPLKRRPSAKSLDVQSTDKSNFEITEKAEQTTLKRTSEEPLNSQQSKHRSETEINKTAEQSTLEITTLEESLNSLQSKHAYNQEINRKAEKSILKRRPSEKAQDLNLAHLGPQSKDTPNPEINKKAKQLAPKRKISEKSLNLQHSEDTSKSEINRKTEHSITNKSHEKSLYAAVIKNEPNPEINKNAGQRTLKRRLPEKLVDAEQIKYKLMQNNRFVEELPEIRKMEVTPNKAQNAQNVSQTTSPSKIHEIQELSSASVNDNAEHIAFQKQIENSEYTTPLESTPNLNSQDAVQKHTESNTTNKDAEDTVLIIKTELPGDTPELNIITDSEINKREHSLDVSQSTYKINTMTEHLKVDEPFVESGNKATKEIVQIVNEASKSNKAVTQTPPKNNSTLKMLREEKLIVVSGIRDTFQRHSQNSKGRCKELQKDGTFIDNLEDGPIDVEWTNSNRRNSYRLEAVQGEAKNPDRAFKNCKRFRLPYRDIAKTLLTHEQEVSTSAVLQPVEEHTNTTLDMPIIVSSTMALPPSEIISIGYSQLRTQQNPLEKTPQSTTDVPPEIINIGCSQQNPPEETPQNVIQISIAASLNGEIGTVGIVNKHLPVTPKRIPQLLANMPLLRPSRPVIKCKPASALLSSLKQPLKQQIKPFDRLIAELSDIGLTLHEDISLPDLRTLTRYDADVGWQKLKVSLYVSENRFNFFCIQATDDRGRLAIRKESAGNQRQILESLQTRDIQKTIEKNAEALSFHVLYETARFMSTVTKTFQKLNSKPEYLLQRA